jgi:UDP-N-acetylglucosamine--N-acetylmuramyl-(pentapeptide) pyrophosphoryl-undecaprenol N-acetylglucosamine transferase
VIISGGGTGGHIFPAIAIANTLRTRIPDIDILFIGAKDKMEMEKVPAAGYPIEGLWISGLQRKLTLKNLSFPFKVLSSLVKAGTIINRFKPDVVVGVGGFASGPVLRIATNKGIPTVIQEQNSFPGITNRLLAKKVNKICVAFDGMEKYFPKEKIVLTGNPVRKEVIDIDGKKDEALKYFGLESGKKTILVIGGSQGALTINKSIHTNLDKFIKNDIHLIWQTGKYFFETAQAAVKDMSSNGIKAKAFIDKMDYAYALADVIISRAGAIAISEICAVGKPVILVPLPSAAEDHQTKNAMSLVEKNAAFMVRDAEVNSKLTDIAIQLINDPAGQQVMSRNLINLSHVDAAEKIADEILALIKNK